MLNQSEFLSIEKKDAYLIREWEKSKLQDFYIPEPLNKWLQEEVFENGIKNITFTLLRDKMAQLLMINSLNEVSGNKDSKFFLNRKDVLQYLFQERYNEDNNEVHYSLVAKKDRVNLDLEVSYNVLPKTISCITSLKKQLKFAANKAEKYALLTKQEKQVLKLICQGMSSKEVAAELFIEPSTVSTHRKKINKKLEAKSCVDLYRYGVAFNLIEF